MNIVIVEDEFMVAKRLKRFVESIFTEQVMQLKLFESLEDAAEYLSEQSIDLLLLDLNLNGMDGFELLKQQVSQSFHTIVVSANTDRAIEAFEIGVLDFIAKPFSKERVAKAISRLHNLELRGQSQYIIYKKLGKIELLPISEIIYLQASGHYCEIFTHDNEIILHDKSLDKLLCILPSSFQRIHRSYAAPLQFIQSISTEEGSKYWLTLKNGQVLPVGRTRIKALREQLI